MREGVRELHNLAGYFPAPEMRLRTTDANSGAGRKRSYSWGEQDRAIGIAIGGAGRRAGARPEQLCDLPAGGKRAGAAPREQLWRGPEAVGGVPGRWRSGG